MYSNDTFLTVPWTGLVLRLRNADVPNNSIGNNTSLEMGKVAAIRWNH